MTETQDRIELADCESTILSEISNKKCNRKDGAKIYALALKSSERKSIDWRKVNRAIIDRWSTSALQHIKRLVWSGKVFES